MLFLLSVVIACVVFALLGSAVLRRSPLALPFTSIWFGQMAAWVGAFVVLPVAAGLERALGVSPPLGFWLLAGLAVAIASNREAIARTREELGETGWLFGVVGLGGTLTVAYAYSVGSHLGALGLDTHQHIYWTRQLIDAHHMPLVERGTDVLALYPRGFHLLSGLWTSAGISEDVGPWVKLMPFLQAWIPCLAFAEILCRGDRRATVALGVAATLVVFAFGLSRMSFPEHDLSGTPRYASGAALLFPWFAVVAGARLGDRSMGAIGLASLPALLLLLLSLNAIVAVQFVVFVGPLLLSAWWWNRERFTPPPLRWITASCSVAALVALQDPWIVAQWSPRIAPGYVENMGAITPAQAAERGLLSQDELVVEGDGDGESAPPRYASLPDFARLFAASLGNGARDTLTSGWAFPFRQVLTSDVGRVLVRLVLLAAIGLAILRRGKDEGREQPPLLLPLAVGALLGAFGQHAFFHFAEGLEVGRGYSFALLRDYSDVASRHTALPLAGMALAASVHSLSRWRSDPIPFAHPAAVIVLALVFARLPVVLHGMTETVDPERSFWAPVAASDLADLRVIQAHVAQGESVLVPAAAWGIGEERWIIPQGATASVLPFSDLRLVFNVRLGPSVFYNWRDVVAFCDGSDESRAEFLARHGIAWFLWKRPANGGTPGARPAMCKLPPARLGIEEPAVHVAGTLELFRIDPARLRGADDSQEKSGR